MPLTDPETPAAEDPASDDPAAGSAAAESTSVESTSVESPAVEHGEILLPSEGVPSAPEGDGDGVHEAVSEPAKVMRVGSMIKQLLEEVRSTELDEASRERVKEIYETSVRELASALSPDLQQELDRLTPPFAEDEVPSEAELRVAKAQLVGWLEGLFHGIQATLFAQQMAARQQLDGMRGQLPQGPEADPGRHAGQYL